MYVLSFDSRPSESRSVSNRFLAKKKEFLTSGRRVAMLDAVIAMAGSTIDHFTRFIPSHDQSSVSVRLRM